MPVNLPPVPDDTQEAFLNGLDDFLWSDPQQRTKIKDHPGAVEGIKVFRVTLSKLKAGERTAGASEVGWRIFYRDKSGAVAADVAKNPKDGTKRMTSLSRDEKLGKMIDFVREFRDGPRFRGPEGYELRLLRMPSITLETCWFKSNTNNPKDDVFVPIISGLKTLTAREVYTFDQFFGKAEEVAGAVQEMGAI